MQLRTKLLIPTSLAAAMVIIITAYAGISGANTQQADALEKRSLRIESLRDFMLASIQECSKMAKFIAEDPFVIDGLQTKQQELILDSIVPIHQNLKFEVATLYNPKGEVVASSSQPGFFGKKDE